MTSKVLGISASPFPDGNVERMITYMINRSNHDGEMVRLRERTISPCMGCAQLCADDNLCKLNDGLTEIFPKILEAEVLILGGPCYFDGPNALMILLLERLWCMRHLRFPLKGKPFFVVASGGIRDPNGVVDGVRNRMEAYCASFAGAVTFFSGNLPCFKCGFGKKCQVGSIRKSFTKEQVADLDFGPSIFRKWEDSSDVRQKLDNLVGKIKNLT